MNDCKNQMLEVLKCLRDDYGALAVKAEFEAEGSRTDELIMLNEVVFRADMPMIIKIGGCEAVRDLDQCRILGASGIMAPMIETPFAMSKFVAAGKKVYGDEAANIEWIINTETKTCYENFDAIMEAGKGFINTIAVGRVDLSGSLGLSRKNINDEKMFELTSDFAKRAMANGLRPGFGGGISMEAVPFICRMAPYAKKFETRKVVFTMNDNPKHLREGIAKAIEFEMLYLQNKCDFYGRMANEDADRLKMMAKRLEEAKAIVAAQ